MESRDQYVARKKAKGRFGAPKPYKFEGKPVLTGYCPCDHCGHELMWDCDPGNLTLDGCKCCNQACT